MAAMESEERWSGIVCQAVCECATRTCVSDLAMRWVRTKESTGLKMSRDSQEILKSKQRVTPSNVTAKARHTLDRKSMFQAAYLPHVIRFRVQ